MSRNHDNHHGHNVHPARLHRMATNQIKGRMRTVPNWKDSTWEHKRQLAHDMRLDVELSTRDNYIVPEGERLDDNNTETPSK